MNPKGVEKLRFGEEPNAELGGGDDTDAVVHAVLLLAHRAVWLGEGGKLIYDLDEMDGHEVPAMRVIVTVEAK